MATSRRCLTALSAFRSEQDGEFRVVQDRIRADGRTGGADSSVRTADRCGARVTERELSTMSNDAQVAEQQRRYREFLDLLPLTLSLAGLPTSEGSRYYSEEQIEARGYAIRHAYKQARSLAREAITR